MSIAIQIQRLQQAKSDIIDAIETKGVQVPLGSTMDDMAELILKIGEEAGDQGPIYTSYIIDQTPIIKNNKVVGSKFPEDVIIGQAAKESDLTVEINGETVYKNVIRRIRANSHCYISRIENGSGVGYQNLWQLDDNDHFYLKDGVTETSTVYNATTDDIVMKMPDFWWKIEQLDQDGYKFKVSFCMSQNDVDNTWNFWDGKTCIGVYKACNQSGDITTTDNDFDNYFYSQPNREIVRETRATFRTTAHNSEFGGQPLDYECYQIMALLGFGWYSTTGISRYTGIASSSGTTGYTESFGMEDTQEAFVIAGQSGYYSSYEAYNKFWGLENWIGGFQEMMPFSTCTGVTNESTVTFTYQLSRYENDPDQVTIQSVLNMTEDPFNYDELSEGERPYLDPSYGIVIIARLFENKYLIPSCGTEIVDSDRGFDSYLNVRFIDTYVEPDYVATSGEGIFGLSTGSYNNSFSATRLMIRPKEDVVITLMN